MDVYAKLVRPTLFRFSADTAHRIGRYPLRSSVFCAAIGARSAVVDKRLQTELAGISLSNPVGLAPGLDKEGNLVSGLQHFGFGYLVVGSVTPLPRPGNPYPRLVRYPERLSIVNSMGLPSKGIDSAVHQLRHDRITKAALLVSVAGFAPDEIIACVKAVEPFAAAVEVGLVCPNSTESERMDERTLLESLVMTLGADKTKPIFIKLPPIHTEADEDRVLPMVESCVREGIDGVSVSGGRTVTEPGIAGGSGSIAGADTFEDSLRNVTLVGKHSSGQLVIRASGGVMSGDDAVKMFRAGAKTVEIYSAFIYHGWNAAKLINTRLVEMMNEQRAASVYDLV